VQVEYLDYSERWLGQETVFGDEIGTYWGDWGVDSEVGRLRAVLLRRPGKEIETVSDPKQWRWNDVMDPVKAREEHDALAECYSSHGVKVYYVETQREDRPNALYMRDNVFMTPEGAIVARQALPVRRGEEAGVEKALADLGVPIIHTIHGAGIYEGACVMWINRETVLLGTGVRANLEGMTQVQQVLTSIGVKRFIRFPIPYGHAHIDGVLNFVDKDKVIMFPWQVSYDAWKELRGIGITILEAPSIEEVKRHYALNVVAIEPGKVVMPKGSPQTRQLLEENGVEVIEIEISELLKGGGGPHCLKREAV